MSTSDSEVLAGIRAAWATWFAGMEARDVEQTLSAASADVVQVGPDGARRVGRDELARALAEFHERYAERVSWEVESVSMSGSDAEVRIREVATVRPRDGGGSVRVCGTHRARLARQGSGRWLIVEDTSRIEGEPTPVPHGFELDAE